MNDESPAVFMLFRKQTLIKSGFLFMQEISRSLVRAGLVIDIKKASWLQVGTAIVNVQVFFTSNHACLLALN